MTTNFKSPIQRPVQKGFTLVETLIAVSILLVAVVGPISLIGDSLHRLYYAKDEMIAINLAQEGVEVARQVRDSNMLAAVAWNTNLSANKYVVDVAKISTGNNPLITCVACAVQPVYFNTAAGLYGQGTVYTSTPFKRIVTITDINANEINVAVTVTWQTAGQTGTISVSENIFRWAIIP